MPWFVKWALEDLSSQSLRGLDRDKESPGPCPAQRRPTEGAALLNVTVTECTSHTVKMRELQNSQHKDSLSCLCCTSLPGAQLLRTILVSFGFSLPSIPSACLFCLGLSVSVCLPVTCLCLYLTLSVFLSPHSVSS
jgi:hypothetical protein